MHPPLHRREPDDKAWSGAAGKKNVQFLSKIGGNDPANTTAWEKDVLFIYVLPTHLR